MTDLQRQKIIADYMETRTYSETARVNNVSRNTVKAIILNEPDIAQKCQQKKEENTQEILNYMNSRKEQAKQTMDALLTHMNSPEKMEAATLPQLATAFGILADKFHMDDQSDDKNAQIFANMYTLLDIASHPAPDRHIEDYESPITFQEDD